MNNKDLIDLFVFLELDRIKNDIIDIQKFVYIHA